MADTRKAWVSSSIVAGTALALWVSFSQLPTLPYLGPTDIPKASPLQIELQILDNRLTRWIDDQDPVARGHSLESIESLYQVAFDELDHFGETRLSAVLPMIASLKAGMHALTIQDRLILLAEEEVRRAQSPASVDRLFRANERREEIILMMIQPAISLLETRIARGPSAADEAGELPTQMAGV
ncbi:MAG: hypothetical protein AAFW76_00680 [Pseudomonadota bacterium]